VISFFGDRDRCEGVTGDPGVFGTGYFINTYNNLSLKTSSSCTASYIYTHIFQVFGFKAL